MYSESSRSSDEPNRNQVGIAVISNEYGVLATFSASMRECVITRVQPRSESEEPVCELHNVVCNLSGSQCDTNITHWHFAALVHKSSVLRIYGDVCLPEAKSIAAIKLFSTT